MLNSNISWVSSAIVWLLVLTGLNKDIYTEAVQYLMHT